MATHTLHILGMHCTACVSLTEMELKDHPEVQDAKSSLTTQTVTLTLTGELENLPLEQIAETLSKQLSQHRLSTNPATKKTDWKEIGWAGLITLLFVMGFIGLQRADIVNWVTADTMNYGTAFFIGIIASLSTCMAVVGGLVLSLSATYAQKGDRWKPQALFHCSRLISFFLLGGAIGVAGSAFKIGQTGTFILSVIVAVVMVLLGLNLLEIAPWSKKMQLSMPKQMTQHAKRLTQSQHTLMPALVGAITFFLPCGFTQSMQVYTLSTGNFLTGGLTMLTFALGTFPVLALLSFSSAGLSEKHRGLFFKTAGMVVILFAAFNLINSLAAIGWINPIFNF